MSFNKRVFSKEMLLEFYLKDKNEGITKAIGNTDGFYFQDLESKEIIHLWMENKKEDAIKFLENVFGIPS